MGVELNVKVDDKQVQKSLGRIQRSMSDLTPAMRIIGEIVLASIRRNFEAGGRPRWPGLSAATIAQRKARKKWPGQILIRSGALLRSINYRPGPESVAVSTNKIYAAVHQFGARKGQFGKTVARVRAFMRRNAKGKPTKVKAHTRSMTLPWGGIPARPYMMIQGEDWPEITSRLQAWMLKRA